MTDEYHHDDQGRPRIILPPQGAGKVIQVRIKHPENFLFVCGRFNEFHCSILEEALKKFNLEYDGEEIDSNREDQRYMPNREGDNYVLINAGSTNRNGNNILIGGVSGDYLILFNEEPLEKVIPHIPEEIKFKYVMGEPTSHKNDR